MMTASQYQRYYIHSICQSTQKQSGGNKTMINLVLFLCSFELQSFYCRWCSSYLQQRCGLAVMDYRIYFETMCNEIAPVEDYSHKSLHEIHNHFMYNLRVTDRPLSELLETIVLKATALNWK